MSRQWKSARRETQFSHNCLRRSAFDRVGIEGLERRTLFAAIAGTVFNDANGDGHRQDGEGGLGNRNIYLDSNNNGQRDDGERAAITHSDGRYALEELEGGTYRVREALPEGWEITTPADGFYLVEVEAGHTVDGVSFGNREIGSPPPAESGTLRGAVFNDANGDGSWQDGEAGLGGRIVYLDQNDNGHRDEGEHAAETHSDGRYAFEGLPAGTYRLREALPAGWTLTAPEAGVYVVELAAGQTIGGLRFGIHHDEPAPPPPPHPEPTTASIRGLVFKDLNGDGSRNEGEPALAGWLIYLDQNRNGHRDEGEHGALTSHAGTYAFEALPVGDYRVQEAAPDGWTVVRPAEGFYDLTLGAGESANERNFANRHPGEVPPAVLASVRGVVFNDLNGNGTREDGEAGLGGRVVFLDQNENGHHDEGEHAAETHSDGHYAFEGLAAGSYRVRQIVPEGWTIIRPGEGFYQVELLDGQRADDLHFANRHNDEGPHVGEPPPPAEHPEGEIGGHIFHDTDADGVHDEGETGVAHARVFLDANDNGRRDRREIRAVTDATGAYLLSGVPAGDHVVRHLPPKGFRSVTPNFTAAVSVSAGERAAAGDFAVTRKSLLHGTVFHDATGNHAHDTGEAVHAGLVVFLDLNRNNVADAGEPTALTDAEGRYSFLVDRGSYRVGEILPAGWQSQRGGIFHVKVGAARVVARDFANRPA